MPLVCLLWSFLPSHAIQLEQHVDYYWMNLKMVTFNTQHKLQTPLGGLQEIISGDLEQLAAKPGWTLEPTCEVCKADFLALTTEMGSVELEAGSPSSGNSADLTSWKTRGQRDKTRRLRNKWEVIEIYFVVGVEEKMGEKIPFHLSEPSHFISS